MGTSISRSINLWNIDKRLPFISYSANYSHGPRAASDAPPTGTCHRWQVYNSAEVVDLAGKVLPEDSGGRLEPADGQLAAAALHSHLMGQPGE